MDQSKQKKSGLSQTLDSILKQLNGQNIVMENLCCEDTEGSKAKIVCIEHDLGGSVREMGKSPRGETLMVRIDEETSNTLDRWVETGYFKSRSEAAALFMREGLKIRASELEKLKDALSQVQQAKDVLRDKADEIFGKAKEA